MAVAGKLIRKSWEDKMAAKAIHQAIKSKEKSLIDARIEEKKRKKQEREDRKKRKEQNQLKSAVYQVTCSALSPFLPPSSCPFLHAQVCRSLVCAHTNHGRWIPRKPARRSIQTRVRKPSRTRQTIRRGRSYRSARKHARTPPSPRIPSAMLGGGGEAACCPCSACQ